MIWAEVQCVCIAVVKVCFFMFYLTISQIQKSGFIPQPHILIPHFVCWIISSDSLLWILECTEWVMFWSNAGELADMCNTILEGVM